MEYFHHIPCGARIPENNPHAVSVSLPTVSDVIGYEEGSPGVVDKMQNAYPRFKLNKLVQSVHDYIKTELAIGDNEEIIPVSSIAAVTKIERHIGKNCRKVIMDDRAFILEDKNSSCLSAIKELRQHAGLILSSRKAEDYLLNNRLLDHRFDEELESEESAVNIIKTTLAEAYGMAGHDDIFLCSAGTNGVYAAFEALKAKRGPEKNIFIQYGWLYMDTMEIIRKYSEKNFIYLNISDSAELEQYILDNAGSIAAVFTEVPNNPLIQCIDLPKLSALLKKNDIPLVIDATVASAYTVEVMEYSDIAVESLTKFACGHGDVLMGAVLLNKNSQTAQSLKDIMNDYAEMPYIRDLQRLAVEIKGYRQRVEKVSQNTFDLVRHLSDSDKIRRVNWAMDNLSCRNYLKIRKNEDLVPGVISVIFNGSLSEYYDELPVAKGPSFGTEFTLAMPYVLLAHYDMLQNEAGRSRLNQLGLDPGLLRISVGTEPVSDLMALF